MLNIYYVSQMFPISVHGLNHKNIKRLKSKTVLKAFIKIANESNCKPKKLWVNQGKKVFCKKLMPEWLDIMIF